MGQKINPLGFRLGITQKYQSYWFIKEKEYSQLLIEDFFLRKEINTIFQEARIIQIEIQRKVNQIEIEIKTALPPIIFGEEEELENLKITLEKFLINYRNKNFYFYKKTFPLGLEKPKIKINVVKVSNPEKEANFIAEVIVEQLQNRIPFRRAMKQAIQRVQKAGVKGIKIQVSGRLNGAEIARSEWIREGRVPLQTLKAKIDYSYKTAKTIYGIIGIKIWIFKEEWVVRRATRAKGEAHEAPKNSKIKNF